MLLNEIYHRVKNNLQIIASLLNLQVGQVRDPHFSVLISESESRVRTQTVKLATKGLDFRGIEIDPRSN